VIGFDVPLLRLNSTREVGISSLARNIASHHKELSSRVKTQLAFLEFISAFPIESGSAGTAFANAKDMRHKDDVPSGTNLFRRT
jgi:hypothetical protein